MHGKSLMPYDPISSTSVQYPNRYGNVEDEARLLYVAMTRAIEVLVMTCDRASEFVARVEGALEKVG